MAKTTIPVELLLSHIGKQVKVDIEAHRAELKNEIEKRRQRLEELRQRRLEVGDIETDDTPADDDIADLNSPDGDGSGLFDAADDLGGSGSDDWLLDVPGDGSSDSVDLSSETVGGADTPMLGDDVFADLDWPDIDDTPSGDNGDRPAEQVAEVDSDWPDIDDTPDGDRQASQAGGDRPAADAGLDWPDIDDISGNDNSDRSVGAEAGADPSEPPAGKADRPADHRSDAAAAVTQSSGIEEILSDVADLDPDLLDEDWEF